jgi:hypothetical protein
MKPFSPRLSGMRKVWLCLEEDFLNFYALIFTAAISTTTLNRQVKNVEVFFVN